MNTDARLTAKLLSACPPDSAQKEKLEDVLAELQKRSEKLGNLKQMHVSDHNT